MLLHSIKRKISNVLIVLLQYILIVSCSSVPAPRMDDPQTLRDLRDQVATVHVLTNDDMVLGSGTVFAISDMVAVTAEHVCSAVIPYGKLVLMDYAGEMTRLFVAEVGERGELCLLYGEHRLTPLGVAWNDVEYGDPVWVFGSPNGFPNVITKGHALGEIMFPGLQPRRALSVQAYFGNSGGPVLNADGQVVGVLVAGLPRYNQLSFSATHERLLRIIEKGL